MCAVTNNAANIPIAQIETKLIPSDMNVSIASDFAKDSVTHIAPFESFPKDKILLFNEQLKPIECSLIEQNGTYIYKPENAIEFTPEQFSLKALIKRSVPYSSDDIYNISLGIVDDDHMSWANDMVSVCADAGRRSICPQNIMINNGAFAPQSFINKALVDNDFVFVKVADYNEIKSSTTDVHHSISNSINIDELLNQHINVWISVKSPDNLFAEKKGSYSTNYKNSVLYPGTTFQIPESYGYEAFQSAVIPLINKQTDKFINHTDQFSDAPVIILEKKDCAYLIISQQNFFTDIHNNTSLFYDILASIYLNSYVLTKSVNSFISDYPVNYLNKIGNIFNKEHFPINLNDLITEPYLKYPNHYIYISLIIDNPNVIYTNIQGDGTIDLLKTGSVSDPPKLENSLSIYTSKDTILQYTGTPCNLITKKVSISYKKENDGSFILKVGNIVNSRLALYNMQATTLKITDIQEQYVIYALPNNAPIKNKANCSINIMPAYLYQEKTGHKIADISIKYTTEKICHDIRIMGGGLPYHITERIKRQLPEYLDLLDMTDLKGRLYRSAGTSIVRLPIEYKKYDQYIKQAINTYKNASSNVMIYYEQKGNHQDK